MEPKMYTGTISFVHHQKHYATIDYKDGDKKKTINFQSTPGGQALPSTELPRKKKHQFRTGDTVQFQLKLTPRGDRLNASNVKFLYNNELEKLLQKAAIDNQFKGFLKLVDDTYFVKEISSYLFFPLVLSQWENIPATETFNEAVNFRLINTDKQNIAAALANPAFIPAYKTALKHYRNKTPVEAIVSRISPYAVYLDVIGKSLQAKLPIKPGDKQTLKPGDKIMVRINYLSPGKIAIEKV